MHCGFSVFNKHCIYLFHIFALYCHLSSRCSDKQTNLTIKLNLTKLRIVKSTSNQLLVEYTHYISNIWKVSYRNFLCKWAFFCGLKFPISLSTEWHQTCDRQKLLAWVLHWVQIKFTLTINTPFKRNDELKTNPIFMLGFFVFVFVTFCVVLTINFPNNFSEHLDTQCSWHAQICLDPVKMKPQNENWLNNK